MTQVSGFSAQISAFSPSRAAPVVQTGADSAAPRLLAVSHALEISAPGGSAAQSLDFLGTRPNWSKKEQLQLTSNFQKGLKQHKLTEAELNGLLQGFGLNYALITQESVANPDYADNIKILQSRLNQLLQPLKTAKGKKFKLPVSGKFDQATLLGLIALRDSQRGPAVSIPVAPMRQIGAVACYHASSAMFFNAVHFKSGKPDAYTEKDYDVRIAKADLGATAVMAGVTAEDARGKLTVNRSKSMQMLDFIDQTLDSAPRRPVVIGVSSRKQEAGSEYNEGITDHFVLLTGRGYDAEGLFYTFNDPFAGGGDFKFRLDPFAGKLYGIGDSERSYDVSMAKAYHVDQARVDHYSRIGKPVLNPGAKGKAVLALQKQLQQLGFNQVKLSQKFDAPVVEAIKQIQTRHGLPVTGKLDSYTQTRLPALAEPVAKNN